MQVWTPVPTRTFDFRLFLSSAPALSAAPSKGLMAWGSCPVFSPLNPGPLGFASGTCCLYKAGGQDGCLGPLAIGALPLLGLGLGLNVAQGLLVSTWLGFPC